MREPFASDQLLLSKHALELSGGYLPGSVGDLSVSPEGSPDRKRRRMNGEQQQKRQKYDVLKSFFRVYFKVDNQSMVLKDAIFNLYQRKIPNESRIARNAMYRHMWSFFKDDKISAFQSNYREYIKGIKLITGAPGQEQPLAYDGFEKDLEVLQSIGVQNLFDFHEEELAKNASDPPLHHLGSPMPMGGLPPHMHGPPHSPDFLKQSGDSSEDELINTMEGVEAQVKLLLLQVKDLKAKMMHRKSKKQ